MSAIDGAAIYLPRYRIDADDIAAAWENVDMPGIDRKAVPAADEDAITMAVAAGERLFESTEIPRADIGLVSMATTTPPLAEDALLGRIVRALGLPTTTEGALCTGSTLAGASAFSHACGGDVPALVLVADVPAGDPGTTDRALGGGAAAFLVQDDGAAELVGRGVHTDEAAGVRYRAAADDGIRSVGITSYERGAVRAAVAEATAKCGDRADWDAVDGIAVHQPDGDLPQRLAGALPVDGSVLAAGTVVDRVGDLGAATVPIGLARLLEDAARPAACFFGGGSAQAMVFEGTLSSVAGLEDLAGGESISYSRYLRLREHLGEGSVDGGGARVSLPNWERSIPQRYRLEAGACRACGTINFPPAGACQECHEREGYTPRSLATTGRIEAMTVIGQGGAPPEFAAQQRKDGGYTAAIVSLASREGDGRARLPAQVVDRGDTDLSVGSAVRATFRRIYEQEGIVRYGIKFVPT